MTANELFKKGHNIPLGECRVIDHCHFRGHYRGPAHSNCNLWYKIDPKSWKFPIVIHNLKGYDSHLITKSLIADHGKINLMPNNMEKYMSMSIGHLRFIDSFQFMNSSLEKLVETRDSSELNITRAQFRNAHEFDLVEQKSDYLNSLTRFQETSLPPPGEFKSKLTGKEISEEKYQLPKDVWDVFNCKTLEDYHDIYLQTDITLLADVFEKFWSTCKTIYGLDPAHYLSAPGFAFDAALK